MIVFASEACRKYKKVSNSIFHNNVKKRKEISFLFIFPQAKGAQSLVVGGRLHKNKRVLYVLHAQKIKFAQEM